MTVWPAATCRGAVADSKKRVLIGALRLRGSGPRLEVASSTPQLLASRRRGRRSGALAEHDRGVSWTRYEGRARADSTLVGDALLAELQDQIRVHNPHLTDVRLEQATVIGKCDATARPPGCWYQVTYLADDGEGQQSKP